MSDCKHTSWTIHGNDPLGFVRCDDCGNLISLSIAINALMAEVRESINELNFHMEELRNFAHKTDPKRER